MLRGPRRFFFFFLNDTAPPEIYTLPLHDALPISERLRQRRPVAAPDSTAALGDQRRDRADAVGDEVASGENAEDARDRRRALDVDRDHVGVRVRRAHERGVGLARRIAVFGVAAPPGQQPEILTALDRRTDAEAGHDGDRIPSTWR